MPSIKTLWVGIFCVVAVASAIACGESYDNTAGPSRTVTYDRGDGQESSDAVFAKSSWPANLSESLRSMVEWASLCVCRDHR